MSARGRTPAAAPFERFISQLAGRWRNEARLFHHRGADVQATALESCAADLEQEALLFSSETMTLRVAEAESGYSYSALEKKVREGTIPNAGKSGAPRIRRSDLPKKAEPQARPTGEPDLVEMVLVGTGTPSHIPGHHEES